MIIYILLCHGLIFHGNCLNMDNSLDMPYLVFVHNDNVKPYDKNILLCHGLIFHGNCLIMDNSLDMSYHVICP